MKGESNMRKQNVNRSRWGVPLVAALLALATTASASAAPPANTAAPTITGTARVGETLTAQNGSWTNSPTAFQYQWQRCNASGALCVNIGTATQRTYTVASPDASRTLRVRVTAVNADGATNARSAPTAVVPPNTGPQVQQRPSIEGQAKVGEELALDAGTWEPEATSFAYQWQRCDFDALNCVNVGGATGETYGVRSGDIGYRMRVQVTARNAGGAGTATSNLSDVVDPAVAPNARPSVRILSIRFLGNRVYARFRVCDDGGRNLSVLATDSRPGRVSLTRRFSTRAAPNPCGVYTRSWLPAQRFRGKGRYTITLRARDTGGSMSAPARRTFAR
jgi:hypothetical protein